MYVHMYVSKRKMLATGMFLLRSFLVILPCLVVNTNGQVNPVPGQTGVHRRMEYKYSFKPPYLAQKDGTVPFWEYGGNAIASSDSVRVAPSLRSQKGAIWSKKQTNFDWWEVEVTFRITGRGRIGADGLAFWYTAEKGEYNGSVFGSSDPWNGLGLFFDSFDNDNKQNNPYIMAVVNNGEKKFDHQNDGVRQPDEVGDEKVHPLSGCLRDFRNNPHPVRARIEYYKNVLTVLIHNGMTTNNEDYELCLRADNVFLPKNGHFGVSAATGGLADDHDVISFITTSLHPPGQIHAETAKVSPDSDKLAQEYREYQDKLEKQKQEYKKEHPDDDEDEWDKFYESENQRELRQIWQGQSQIFEHIRELSRKMDEMIGRQENTMSLVARSSGQPAPVPAGGAVPVVAGGSTISRAEVDLLIANQNALLTAARELRTLVVDVTAKADTIIQTQRTGSGGHVQPAAGYDIQAVISEMRDGMNQVKQGISHVGQKLGTGTPQAKPLCPTSNCVGVTMFLGVTAVQLLLVFLYSIFKSRSEAQAKKFY